MAKCPHCQFEYEPIEGQIGCQNCQGLLAASDPSKAEAEAVGTGSSDAGVKMINPGDGIQVLGPLTINNNPTAVYCAVGGERLYADRGDFRCLDCEKSPVCEEHFDKVKGVCWKCAQEQVAEKTLPCMFCGGRTAADQVFSCPKCLKVGEPEHKSANRNLCEECSAQYDRVVENIEDGQVGIGPGGAVVTRAEVDVIKGKAWDRDGNLVSTIRDQTWFARRRQWHIVKPQLLVRERQAMGLLYPHMETETSPSGYITWRGTITTWPQNSYEVELHYPMMFPFTPPRVFVVSPKIAQSRHIYKDGHLCLFHEDDKAWRPETTAATMMSWVSLWLHCYEVWQETGEWPRREADEMVITLDY